MGNKKLVVNKWLPSTMSEFLDKGTQQDIFKFSIIEHSFTMRVNVYGEFRLTIVYDNEKVLSYKQFKLTEEGYQRMAHFITEDLLKLGAELTPLCKEYVEYFEKAFVTEE